MKKLLLFLVLIFSLGACTNEDYLDLQDYTVNVVKAPNMIAYSGNHYWSNLGTRSFTETSNWSSKESHEWGGYKDNAPAQVQNDEWEYVKEYLVNHPDEGYTTCDLTDYFIQWVGKSYASYTTQDNHGASHVVTGSNQMDYVVIDGVHLNDYNGGYGPITLCQNWPLIDPWYHDSYGNNEQHNLYRFYYIEYNGVTNLYLCFDYATKKDSGELIKGDGIFNDWVLKITPANGSPVVEPSDEGQGEPNDDPVIKNEAENEVEVNLHGIDKNNEYLESHLSIHVRAATDVEIFIPVPAQYYCEADDLAIVQKHEPNHMIHGGPYKVEYTLQDKEDGPFTVILNVDFVEEGIRVWTEGINQDVIDFCYKHYKDGITFEIWNYFNDTLDLQELQGYLNQSTIRFLDACPDAYINAFVDDNDCTVTIVNEQENSYNEPVEGSHLNGSNKNKIYKKK